MNRLSTSPSSSTTLSEDLVQCAQREPFEVFAFGMMQAKGMIDRLAESFDDGDFAPRIDGGAEDDFLKKIDGKMLGAGKGQEQTAGIEMLERVQIEKFISAGGGVHVASFRSQRRRVQDDQVELSVDFFQISEGVAFEKFSWRLGEAVQCRDSARPAPGRVSTNRE